MNKYKHALDQLHRLALDGHSLKSNEVIRLCRGFVGDLNKLVDRATPKLVEYEDIGYDYFGGGDNVYACICPKCGLHIIEFNDRDIKGCSDDPKEMFHSCMIHHGYMGLNNFCNRCGQALDWSKEDEKTL